MYGSGVNRSTLLGLLHSTTRIIPQALGPYTVPPTERQFEVGESTIWADLESGKIIQFFMTPADSSNSWLDWILDVDAEH